MQSPHTRMPSLDTGCEKPGLISFIQSDNEQCDLVSQRTFKLPVAKLEAELRGLPSGGFFSYDFQFSGPAANNGQPFFSAHSEALSKSSKIG